MNVINIVKSFEDGHNMRDILFTPAQNFILNIYKIKISKLHDREIDKGHELDIRNKIEEFYSSTNEYNKRIEELILK